MRHHTVLQRGEGGPWHYVSAGKRGAHPMGGCTTDCVHETPDEAYEHHRTWLLDTARFGEVDPDEQRRCEECDAWTQRRTWYDNTSCVVLCVDHSTREVLERLHLPPGIKLDAYTMGGG